VLCLCLSVFLSLSLCLSPVSESLSLYLPISLKTPERHESGRGDAGQIAAGCGGRPSFGSVLQAAMAKRSCERDDTKRQLQSPDGYERKITVSRTLTMYRLQNYPSSFWGQQISAKGGQGTGQAQDAQRTSIGQKQVNQIHETVDATCGGCTTWLNQRRPPYYVCTLTVYLCTVLV
jgi:hypothetical protein